MASKGVKSNDKTAVKKFERKKRKSQKTEKKVNLKVLSEVDPYGLVPRAGCYETRVRRKLTRPHDPVVTSQCGYLYVRTCVVRRERHVIDKTEISWPRGGT